jgi:pimeloyl-ACP methyl ester carboxylesterase
MHVREWGSRDDVPLLFWHALGPEASGQDLAGIAPAIAAAGFRVLAVDAPGFGRSAALATERYRLDSLVDLLHELADERDLDRPVLMGHSWGGAIAVSYAGAYPEDVRALVLLDSGHIDYRDLPDVDVDRTAGDWIAEVRTRPDPRRAEARGMAMHGLTAPVSGAWPAIAAHDIPTLLFLATEPPHGEQNRARVARFESAIPRAEIRWAAGAGHGLLADVGTPLGDEIAAWLVEQGL